MPPADTAAIVAALRAVPGVADARIDPPTNGTTGMLHLALEDGSDETVVADRVAELLRSGFALGVDTEHAQLIEDTAEAGPPAARPGGGRLVIERLRLRTSGLEVHCAVTLRGGVGEATGEAVGAAHTTGTLRAVSAATLRAVEQLAAAPVRLEIERLELTSTGADSTVLVALTMLSGSGSTRLTGAAAVRQDVRQATVRATLDAVNRRLGPLLPSSVGSAG